MSFLENITTQDGLLMLSLTLNLIGVLLTVSSKIRSNDYQIDGGTLSDPHSGFIEIRLGLSYKIGWATLCIGVILQIIVVIMKIFGRF